MKYTQEDIKAIKKILTGIQVPFSFSYINSRMKELAVHYDCVEKFSDKYKMPDVLEMLFDWGIVILVKEWYLVFWDIKKWI